jgi:hypothetical protein
MVLQADKIIQQGDGEGRKKLGLDKDENHVEPLQPPRSIPTQHQSLRSETTNWNSSPATSNGNPCLIYIEFQSKFNFLQVLGLLCAHRDIHVVPRKEKGVPEGEKTIS